MLFAFCFFVRNSLIEKLKTEGHFFQFAIQAFSFTFQFIMISIIIIINHLNMKVTKHECFKDKLNLLSTLINLPVDKRCYNLVGSKIVKSNELIEAIRKECSYEDAKCPTLVEHLVSCWQTSAANYPSTSAEFKSRDRFNFIRTKGETWQIQIPITIYDRTSEQPFYCYYADTY